MNNQEKQLKKPIWFKAKRYGYGWYPATWQGWLIIAIYLVIVVGGAFTLDTSNPSVRDGAGTFLIIDAMATVALILICVKYGEKAKWRWGDRSDLDTPKKDQADGK
jgi:hypothetical protein